MPLEVFQQTTRQNTSATTIFDPPTYSTLSLIITTPGRPHHLSATCTILANLPSSLQLISYTPILHLMDTHTATLAAKEAYYPSQAMPLDGWQVLPPQRM